MAVRAAVDGDTTAFEELVRIYQAQVFRFLCHLVSDRALAEDLTQETFLRAHQRLPDFAGRSKFSTWVFQIARNAGVDALRSRARREQLLELVRPAAESGGPELRAELNAAVRGLSDKLREALLVVEVLGFTYREAAEMLAAPEGTVKSRVFQARERLAEWMAATEEAADEV